MTTEPRYIRPARSAEILNRLVAALTGAGVSVYGSRILRVRGRRTGQWRETPVNLLHHDGADYLVSPRGHTQWVRNLRAAGDGELRVGRRTQRFRAIELADADKPAVLRAYLRRWRFEVGAFFDGVRPDASDTELARIAPGYPVFRLS